MVRNYKAFMHATEEIRTMETGIQTLKDLMANTGATLEVRAASTLYFAHLESLIVTRSL